MTARDQMLDRIRAALRDVPADEPPLPTGHDRFDEAAAYARGRPPGPDAAELFAHRCGEYRATVTRCGGDAAAVRDAVAAACARHGVRVLAAPAELSRELLPAGVEVVADRGEVSLDRLDRVDGALTGCALAIALTGTIALDGGPGQGRRALSLVPDLHICVVRTEQIVHGVPEAMSALHHSALRGRPLTLISGPSATSDIELVRVEGVHGPRRLEVVLAG